ncbi:MAG: hypothetical protein GY805_08025 [Chloroflexi bacterium]|nr:hypothetical protein [Chloroflexota bacterium]
MTPNLRNTLKNNWFLWLTLLLFCGLYLFNISGWLIHDDEGTDFYEIWQLQTGHQPGVDFVAEQQPLFLLIGKTGLNLFENEILALRTIAALQVLGGAFFLGWVVYKIWGNHVAAITVGVTLSSGLVYEQARLFRPDPMMFGWELFGLGFVLLAVLEGKRPYWGLAGICYGVAILMKPFGIFPVVGLSFFFIYQFYAQRERWSDIFANGLTFATPFLLTSLGISLLLYNHLGFYYQEAFGYHLAMGEKRSLINQLINIGDRYLLFFVINAVAAFILPLAYLNRRANQARIKPFYKALLLPQLFVPLVFVVITRPLHVRYFMFLVPTLALLLALEVNKLYGKIKMEQPQFVKYSPLLSLILIGFSIFSTFPSISQRLAQAEGDTLRLAQLIQSRTTPDEIVIADYAGLNFHAKRQSIYEASIIAGGQIGGGIVTGALLIERMEETEAKLILVHVEGGNPPPHQLTHLIDFPLFEAYLAEKYEMIEVFDRANQLIEIYERR